MIVKKFLRSLSNFIAHWVIRLPGSERVMDLLFTASMNKTVLATHKGQKFKFIGVNSLCQYRAESLSTKEPDTLEWIEAIPEGSILWDIGANIGIYSIFAALKRNCQVYSFEPSVFNLEILARNIYANKLQDLITILPIALSDEIGTRLFKMTSTNWGGALSTFGKDFDQNGLKINSSFEYRTLGMTMDDTVSKIGIPSPTFIKIDVDGIEHLVLSGGTNTLNGVVSVLVEINDNFLQQELLSKQYLSNAGLVLYRKRHMVGGQCNQWWIRPA